MATAKLILEARPTGAAEKVHAVAWLTEVEIRQPDGSTVRGRPIGLHRLSRDVAVSEGLDERGEGVAVKCWVEVEG